VGAAAKPKSVVVPMRALSDKEALAWLVGRGRTETSMTKLASDWRWSTSKVKRHLERWSASGSIEVKPGLGGRTIIEAVPDPAAVAPAPAVSVVSPVPPVAVAPAAVAPASAAAISESPAAGVTVEPVAAANDAKPVEAKSADDDAAPAVGPSSAPAASAQPVNRASAPEPVPVVSSELVNPGPPPATIAAAELPARDPAPLPSKVDVAPEPVIMRAPVATVLPPAPPVSAAAILLHPRGSGFVNALAYLVAVALAGIAAYFSITGMIVLFPGAPAAIVMMGVAMEAAKLVTVAFLAHQWRMLARLSRFVLIVLVTGLAAINAAGVYSQLVAAHFGDRVTATSAAETETATLAAKTEVQAQTVADLDRRIAQIDAAIAEMTKRGRAAGALDAIATQRKQRDALVAQRRQEAEKLAALKSDAAAVAARTHIIEVEAAPIMYVAQLMGGTTEQAIRLLILLMVLTCDPLALALTAAASRPRWRRQGA
jgi:hypothetical protein